MCNILITGTLIALTIFTLLHVKVFDMYVTIKVVKVLILLYVFIVITISQMKDFVETKSLENIMGKDDQSEVSCYYR